MAKVKEIMDAKVAQEAKQWATYNAVVGIVLWCTHNQKKVNVSIIVAHKGGTNSANTIGTYQHLVYGACSKVALMHHIACTSHLANTS